MYVRLAFAVAAHLSTEILIVDEVLAVGDTEFQKKCMGKMEQVAHGGRTVLFVSHNISAVAAMTNRCLLLEARTRNPLRAHKEDRRMPTSARPERWSTSTRRTNVMSGEPHFTSIRTETSEPGRVQAMGEALEIRLVVAHPMRLPEAYVTVRVMNQLQQNVTQITLVQSEVNFFRGIGSTQIRCNIPRLRVSPGQYSISACVGARLGGRVLDQVDAVSAVEVVKLADSDSVSWQHDTGIYQEDADWKVDGS